MYIIIINVFYVTANYTQLQVGRLTHFTDLLFHRELNCHNSHRKSRLDPGLILRNEFHFIDYDSERKVWRVLRINGQ